MGRHGTALPAFGDRSLTILVTGAAGFIGAAVARRLLDRGETVVGLDNLNAYYDVSLKRARLATLAPSGRFAFVEADVADIEGVRRLFEDVKPSRVVHLAAQAGVRHAAVDPYPYVASNVAGFITILEGCRHGQVEHLVYASTSSVYGANAVMPFSEHEPAEHPLTLYAATKKANEAMAHSYAHLFGLPCTGLRFFTVYGPWGRPDMALFRFADAIVKGEPIPLFNHGRHRRSFTYIDDIVEGVVGVLDRPPTANPAWDAAAADPATSAAPYRVLNIGSEQSVELLRYVEILEACLGRTAIREMLPLQPGDVPDSAADVRELFELVGYVPKVTVETGVAAFVEWYRRYYGI
jgi:UDP-glucuronate 4-epimerase